MKVGHCRRGGGKDRARRPRARSRLQRPPRRARRGHPAARGAGDRARRPQRQRQVDAAARRSPGCTAATRALLQPRRRQRTRTPCAQGSSPARSPCSRRTGRRRAGSRVRDVVGFGRHPYRGRWRPATPTARRGRPRDGLTGVDGHGRPRGRRALRRPAAARLARHAASPRTPACCCSTSRPRSSTCATRSSCSTSCATSPTSTTSPSASCCTTSTRPPRSPTSSCLLDDGRVRAAGRPPRCSAPSAHRGVRHRGRGRTTDPRTGAVPRPPGPPPCTAIRVPVTGGEPMSDPRHCSPPLLLALCVPAAPPSPPPLPRRRTRRRPPRSP